MLNDKSPKVGHISKYRLEDSCRNCQRKRKSHSLRKGNRNREVNSISSSRSQCFIQKDTSLLSLKNTSPVGKSIQGQVIDLKNVNQFSNSFNLSQNSDQCKFLFANVVHDNTAKISSSGVTCYANQEVSNSSPQSGEFSHIVLCAICVQCLFSVNTSPNQF